MSESTDVGKEPYRSTSIKAPELPPRHWYLFVDGHDDSKKEIGVVVGTALIGGVVAACLVLLFIGEFVFWWWGALHFQLQVLAMLARYAIVWCVLFVRYGRESK